MAAIDRNLRFLIVDDKSNMRRTVRNMLRQVGYDKFVEADDGSVALSKLRSNTVDIILCDWNMPRMTGVEFLRAVREDERWRELPFILVTAEVDQQTVAEAAEEDVDAYVLKPFTPALMQQRIEEVLKKKAEPSPIDTHINLGHVYLNSKQYDLAEKEFKKALALNPTSPRSSLALGSVYEKSGKNERAKQLYEHAVKMAPKYLRAHEALARIYETVGDLPKAAVHLSQAAEISPKNSERQLKLGQVFMKTGRKADAKGVFKKAMDTAREDPAEVARQIGESFLDANMSSEAQGYFEKGIEANPDDVHLYNRLGIAYRKQKKFEEAVTNYKAAIKVDPENEALYYNLSRAYYEFGDRARSEKAMIKALKLYPEFEEAKEFMEHYLS